MANAVIAIDPDRERRRIFLSRLRGHMAPFSGLKESESSFGDFHALWAAAKSAPVSAFSDDRGTALIIGEAIPGPGPARLSASGLAERWREMPGRIAEPLDGFHAAMAWRPDTGFMAGADPLGCFPVYYYTGKDFLLVGTSPELFRSHPDFQSRVDPLGLAGILLVNGPVGNRTVYAGVRRLAPGHLLVWKPSSAPREILQYRLPFSDRHFGKPFEENLQIIHEAMEKMIERQYPGDRSLTQLFSGGLDSRLLGGYLKEKGHRPTAVTFGQQNDVEMKCAKAAVRALGFPHRMIEDETGLFEKNAELEARWRCLSGGFSCVFDWQRPDHFESERVLSGYALESATGGSQIYWGCKPGEPVTMGFDHYFNRMNAWGVPREALQKLLRKDFFGDAIPELFEILRQQYDSSSPWDFQRPMALDLIHRQRFHTLSVAWIHSFGAWPVLPGTDRRLIEAAAGMPRETLENRRIQKTLLRRYFIPLAKAPLDRNSFNLRPLEPSLPRVADALYYKGFELFQKGLHLLTGERRYYYRLMDFNHPGWRAVRRRAERTRIRALEYFERSSLETLLPPPETNLEVRDSIINGSASRLLAGFLLWQSVVE